MHREGYDGRLDASSMFVRLSACGLKNIFIKEILNKGLLKTEKWVTVGSK